MLSDIPENRSCVSYDAFIGRFNRSSLPCAELERFFIVLDYFYCFSLETITQIHLPAKVLDRPLLH
jgi:hypothetical protein